MGRRAGNGATPRRAAPPARRLALRAFGATECPPGMPPGWTARAAHDAFGHGFGANHEWAWLPQADPLSMALGITTPDGTRPHPHRHRRGRRAGARDGTGGRGHGAEALADRAAPDRSPRPRPCAARRAARRRGADLPGAGEPGGVEARAEPQLRIAECRAARRRQRGRPDPVLHS